MSPNDRAANAALVCCYFARNLAYYNAAQRLLKLDREGFWLTVTGNFIDIAVLEWCKLFGNRNGKYHWQKVLLSPDTFKPNTLKALRLKPDEFDALYTKVKNYRVDFVAHLEDDVVTAVPNMNMPYLLAMQYYLQLRTEFPVLVSNVALPSDFGNYFLHSVNEAVAVLSTPN